MKTLTSATNGHMGGTAKVCPPQILLSTIDQTCLQRAMLFPFILLSTAIIICREPVGHLLDYFVSFFHFKSFKNTPVYRIPWLIIMDLDQIPAYPPPPGVISNFKNPVSLAKPLVIVNVMFLSLMMIFVGIRIYTKGYIVRKLGWDDCGCYSFRCSIVTCSHV